MPVRDDEPARTELKDAAIVERFRLLAMRLIFASALIALVLAAAYRVRVDFSGFALLGIALAGLLYLSQGLSVRPDMQRAADAVGTVAVMTVGGMACGAIAMFELRLGFPLADKMLSAWDDALGVNGLAILESMVRAGPWLFALMAPAYNLTIPIFLASLVILSMLGDRVEAWRAALCFIGTLLTTCIVAAFFPAKGLATWASADLLSRLPTDAMRGFWHHFDDFYFGADPVFQLRVIDGVISFPSFHAIVGFLTLAMWRKRFWTCFAASLYLIVMLLGTLPGGGHYIVDLVAGGAVWALWHWFTMVLERPFRQPEPSPTTELSEHLTTAALRR